MTSRTPNLEFRNRSFHYRVSFTLNRKTFSIRLALDTADPVVARERASRLDRTLKQRWEDLVDAPMAMTPADRQSIMRAAAHDARASLERIEAGYLATPYAEPDDGRADHLRSLRGLELVVRDICAHGMHRDFGARTYELHLLDNAPAIDREQLDRLRTIVENGAAMTEGFGDRATEALRTRNVDPTPVNLAFAAREIATGTLLALREAIARAIDPIAAIDSLMASLSMPDGPAGNPASVAASASAPAPPVHHASPVHAPSSSPPQTATGLGAATLKDAAAAFLAAHPRYDDDSSLSAWTPKTRSQFEAAVFLAQKFFGETMVAEIDEMALARFVRTLRRLPANHHKTPTHAGLSLEAIAERAKGATLGIGTMNRHVRFIRLVLDWAGKRMPSAPTIDWRAFIETDKRRKRDKRPAFTEAELETLFSGAVWHGSASIVRRLQPGPHIILDSAYWVPILLAYTGARREEIAKLMITDVALLDGIWTIRIQVTEAGRLKNVASERDVPIADAVLRLGFLAFVERQRVDGHTRLFPELDRTTGTSGDVFYKKWWRAFERAGLLPPGKDMHSIRHYVSTALAAAGVSEERRADLLGHSLSSETAGTYTKRTPLHILREVVNLLPAVTRHVPVGRAK